MSNYENFKTLFETGVENTKSALVDSIKSVFSKENVTIDVSLKDEEASKTAPSELKFPLYSIELSEQNHHHLLMDTDSIKALSAFVDGVEDDAELNDESVKKIQTSLNEILKGSKLSSNDLSLTIIQELPQSLNEFNGFSSSVVLEIEGSKINVAYFTSALDVDDKVDVANPEFSNLSGDGPSGPTHNMQMLMDVELEVQVELGRKKIKIQDVMSLGKGSVLELDKNAGEPLELYINDTKLAEGEVVVVEDARRVERAEDWAEVMPLQDDFEEGPELALRKLH